MTELQIDALKYLLVRGMHINVWNFQGHPRSISLRFCAPAKKNNRFVKWIHASTFDSLVRNRWVGVFKADTECWNYEITDEGRDVVAVVFKRWWEKGRAKAGRW